MVASLSIVSEHGVVTHEGEFAALTFGRSPEADAQVGHAPKLDLAVPRLAGEVALYRGSALVTNHGERLALAVQCPGRPPIDVRPGDRFGPASHALDVLIEGELRHTLRVLVTREDAVTSQRSRQLPGSTTLAVLPTLSDRQVSLLELYVAPLRQGSRTIRTHQQVAEVVSVSRSLVRLEMNAVWLAFDQAGVPMREFDDKIQEVVDAWLRHNL